LPRGDPSQVTVEIRPDEAAIDGDIPCGSGLKREKEPMAGLRVRDVEPKRWVVMVAGG